MLLSDCFRTLEYLSADSFKSRPQHFTAALPFELPPPSPSHFPIPPSAPRRDAAIAAAAAQVVKAENVLLGNYLESLGREASRDRGYLSWDRRRDAASAPPPVKPFPNDYTLVSQKLGVGSYANEMSS